MGMKIRNKPDKPMPTTPEPNYICSNCGMLVKKGHKHSKYECRQYLNSGYTPDHRAMMTLLPSRNQPKIHLPWYYEDYRDNDSM